MPLLHGILLAAGGGVRLKVVELSADALHVSNEVLIEEMSWDATFESD